MIYTDVISKIKTTLDGIDHIQEVFMYPLGEDNRITKYPAVICLPDSMDNEFSDSGSNHRTMRFKLWVIVNTKNIEDKVLYEEVLPKAVDAVFNAFDAGWDFNTFEGHRVWALLSSGLFSKSSDDKGSGAYAELTLTVKLNKDI